MMSEVRSIRSLDKDRGWRARAIVVTDATRGENVSELWEKVAATAHSRR